LISRLRYTRCMPEYVIESNPKLQAVHEERLSDFCVVVTHPHSLMGGDMRNNVVMAAWNTALECGFSAIRFNFRGVGRSGGSFDDGRGEVDDLAVVIDQVKGSPIIIGYSFGAWVAANYLQCSDCPAIFISPPTAMFSFPTMKGRSLWAITGEFDQFCDTEILGTVMENDRIRIARGADHFWFGFEDQLKPFLREKLSEFMRAP